MISKSFSALCLTHSPALEVCGWTDRGTAVAEAGARVGRLGEHKDCDIMLAGYAGGLAEVCCLPGDSRVDDWQRGRPHTTHQQPNWVGVDWLRLIVAVEPQLPMEGTDAIHSALYQLETCWTTRRARRIMALVDPSPVTL